MDHHDAGHAHQDGHGHPPARPFARLRKLLKPETRDVFMIAVYAVAVAILSLATPITIESLVNTVAFGVLLWPVLVLASVLMACLGFAAAIRAMQVYVIESLQRRIFVRIVADYAQRLPRLKLEGLDGHHGPELANRFFDVLNVQKSLATLLLDGVALVVTAFVGMIVLAFYHPFLLGFDVLLVLLIAFTIFGLGWGGIRSCLHESHAKYDVAAWLEELMRCLRTFKFARGQHLALERADHLAGEYVTARREHFRVVWRQTLFSLGLQVVASTTLLGVGGYLVIDRQLTLGQLVAAELIVALVVSSVSKIGKYMETYYDLLSGAEKLGILTDFPLEREGGESLKHTGRGMAIRVHGIDTVSHRSLPSLNDLRITSSERVAILGPHGSGKSTLFELLCGLRDPQHGVVELDGIDLRGLSLSAVREQLAYVEGPAVFVGSVAENIRLGRDDLSLSEIRDALQLVGLLNAVYALPRGVDTQLTPDGGPLSANQTLLLTLARAVIGRPRLLILDGVLDAIDPAQCPELLPCLFDKAAPWTLLVVSSNSDIVRMCDRTIEFGK